MKAMLIDMIINLQRADTEKDRERAYRALERVGMDRRTADMLAWSAEGEADEEE